MSDGLVSTVIPVYNRPAMLETAVQSVLAQSWRPIEILIVDDGSTDDTPAVAEALRWRHPDIIRVLAQRNAGPGTARQTGLDAAHGEFVQFLDSDDRLLPRKFDIQVALLRADPEADLAYGRSFDLVDGLRRPSVVHADGLPQRHAFPAVLVDRLWQTATPLYRRALLTRIGPWSALRQLEDWEYDCRAAAVGATLCYSAEPVAEHVHHAGHRLCHAWRDDLGAMADRAEAYLRVACHAERAGLDRALPEMRRFARSLFWMARSAGARGLSAEAKQLFDRARAFSIAPGAEFVLFGGAASLLGWQRAIRWAERLVGTRQ
jgi:hypothetical protein